MEHLNFILGSTRKVPAISIPYLCDDDEHHPYIGLEKPQGFDNVAGLLKLHDEDLSSFLILLQRWLYFGLLSEVFGEHFYPRDFVVSEGSAEFISTARLPQYSQEWLDRSSSLSTKALEALWGDLNFATVLSNRFDEHSRLRKSRKSQRLLFSIKILIDSLATTVEPVLNSRMHQFSGIPSVEKPEASTYLLHYLQKQGWCPRRLASTSHNLQSQSLYLLAAYEPSALIGPNHQKCTEKACHVDSLEDYPAKHISTCSCLDCHLVHAPIERVKAIYLAGDVPVLSCAADPTTGSLSIEVYPSQDCGPFIAISHVWSDGLGNKDTNALYQCQLVDVVKQVGRLQSLLLTRLDTSQTTPVAQPSPPSSTDSHRILFWLDTLCIPRDQDVRKIAIGRIDWTFAAAEAVLVRDPSIRHLPLFEMGKVQLSVHMRCLNWLTRCWTLAEGIAAWDIYLDFADRASNLADVQRRLQRNRKPQMRLAPPEDYQGFLNQDMEVEPTSDMLAYRSARQEFARQNESWASEYGKILSSEIVRDLISSLDVLNSAKNGRPSFATAWNSVLNRSTTNPEDVPPILAVANSLSIRDVLKLSKATRLKAIINTCVDLPVSFLFNDGPKFVNEPKNKWMPTQVHGGRPISAKPSMQTYSEGRMLGPLETSKFRTLKFPGTALKVFDLLIVSTTSDTPFMHEATPSAGDPLGELRNQLRLRVELLQAGPNPGDPQWCLVLPEGFKHSGFLATTTCVAFCATIQRENVEKVVSETVYSRRKNAAVTWEMLAKVTISPEESEDIPTVQATKFDVQTVYVECDMREVGLVEALGPSLTRNQVDDLDDQCLELKLLGFIFAILLPPVGIALVNSMANASVAVKIVADVLLVAFFFAILIVGCYPTNTSSGSETQAGVQSEWTSIFLDPENRAARSRKYRFQRWLRRKYNSPNKKRSEREDIAEPESQLPRRRTGALGFWRMARLVLSDASIWEMVSLVRLGLCVVELGLLVGLERNLAAIYYFQKSLAIFAMFVPVVISLVYIPGNWLHRQRHASDISPMIDMLDLIKILVWLVHMGILIFASRDGRPPKHYHAVGLAAVVLAGIQLGLIVFLIIERRLSWLATQFEKSPVTYYDLFEDPSEKGGYAYGNHLYGCFLCLWTPYRIAWERRRAMLRHP